MNKLVLKSPAKLNLYLDVLRKRPDGYHDIETIFERIALFDIITIRPDKKGIRIATNAPALPTDRGNLAYRAAELLFKKAGYRNGVRVDIEKNIPIAAGLGGGSSNAAAALSGINRFFKLGFKQGDLINLGKQLGADVPFFLCDSSFAVGSGRGDEVSPIYNNHINIWHIIIAFDFGVSTANVYKSLNLELTPNRSGVKICLPFIAKNDIENLAASLYNKLEEGVLNRFDIVRTTKGLLLKTGAYGAILSGSGPTIFGLTKTREEAIAVRRRLQRNLKRGSRVLVVETMKGV